MSSNVTNELQVEFVATFSDDIRQEVGGKTTLVGIYTTDLIFPELPAFLPKLGVYIIGKFPNAGTDSIKIIVERNDEILMETPSVPSPEHVENLYQKGQDARMGRRMMTAGILLPPMTYSDPCTIRAKVELNGVTYLAGKLHISRAEPVESPEQNT